MNHRPDYRYIAHRLIRAAILAGIGLYVARLSALGHLQLYIAPRMSVYTKLAAAGLYLIAFVLVYQALREWNGERSEGCGCGESCGHAPPFGSRLRQLRVYLLFALPLAAFFLTPDTTIGSAMARQKGMNLNGAVSLQAKWEASAQENSPLPSATTESGSPAAALVGGDAEKPAETPAVSTGDRIGGLDRLFPHDSLTKPYAEYAMKLYGQPTIEIKEKNFLETLTTLNFFPDPFVGRRASISGFVYRDDTVGKGQFVLGRFAIQCCAADALPYGIVVEADDEKRYANDDWMTITGTLSKTTYEGSDILLLRADDAVKIKPAKDPYVYPDMNFGT